MHHFILSIIRLESHLCVLQRVSILALYMSKYIKLVTTFKLPEMNRSVLNTRRKMHQRNKKKKVSTLQPRGVWCQLPAVLWSPGWMKSGCFQSQDIDVRVPVALKCVRALTRLQNIVGALTQTKPITQFSLITSVLHGLFLKYWLIKSEKKLRCI